MLKYSVASIALLALGLSACLDDPTSNTGCQPHSNPVTGQAGDTIITQLGLRYLVESPGSSQQEARWCSLVLVQYTGQLENGTVFDSGTLDFIPGEGGVITGFQFGVVGMRVDEHRRLFIPAALGYGPQAAVDSLGNTVIPPNSPLIFDVTLVSTQ